MHSDINDFVMGLTGSGNLWNLWVWGRKWHGGLVLWQFRGDYVASSVWSATVCPEADSVCCWTEAAVVSNHEHSRESGGDFTAGAGRYDMQVYCSFKMLISFVWVLACQSVFTGIILPSLTSGVYFGAFLGLVWWWIFNRPISMLIFSSLCVMMAIFSGGHLLALYLYQLPLSQQIVPPEDVYSRYRSDYKDKHFNASGHLVNQF